MYVSLSKYLSLAVIQNIDFHIYVPIPHIHTECIVLWPSALKRRSLDPLDPHLHM